MTEFWELFASVILTGLNADGQPATREVPGRELLPTVLEHRQVIPRRPGRELLSTALDISREILVGRHRERPGSRLRTAGYLRDGAQ